MGLEAVEAFLQIVVPVVLVTHHQQVHLREIMGVITLQALLTEEEAAEERVVLVATELAPLAGMVAMERHLLFLEFQPHTLEVEEGAFLEVHNQRGQEVVVAAVEEQIPIQLVLLALSTQAVAVAGAVSRVVVQMATAAQAVQVS